MKAGGKRYIVHPSRSDVFKLWAVGDVHYGNKGSAVDMFLQDVLAIQNDPLSFWIGLGDYADYVGVTDKRFDPACLADDIRISDLGQLGHVLTSRVRDFLAPIKHKCLGLLFGNHEDKYQQAQEQMQLHDWLCTELGVPNLGYSAFVDVVFCRRPNEPIALVKRWKDIPNRNSGAISFRMYLHHGCGFATTPGGKLNKLLQFMDNFDADIYMIAHVHDQTAKTKVVLTANDPCDKITQRSKKGIITGSYLKTYTQGVTGYGEVKGYAPVPLGAVYAEINPETREVHVRI